MFRRVAANRERENSVAELACQVNLFAIVLSFSPQNPGKLVQTDARSDIYSLGATMYHLLTNHEPDPIQTPASTIAG